MGAGPSFHDYKFGQATDFDKQYYKIREKINREEIKETVSFFVDNMNKVHSLGFFPMYLGFAGESIGSAKANAARNVHYIHGATDPQILIDKINRLIRISRHSGAVPERLDHIKTVGRGIIEHVLTTNNRNLNRGIEACLSAMIIGSWTAFEATAEDLWTIAVNTCPSPFAENVINWKRPDPKTVRRKQEDIEKKSIELWVLQKHGFNLQKVMGDVLKSQGKVGFDCLEATRTAYLKAFGEESNKIFERHSRMAVIEQLRNLYAHRAGKVDAKFKANVRNDPWFNMYRAGEVIKLDGELVTSVVDITIQCSLEVIVFVDERIAEHAPAK